MPNKFFESVLAGLPEIFSKIKDSKDSYIKFKYLFAVIRNFKEDHKKDIRNFFKNRGDFILGKENKNYLIEKYRWEHQENKLLNIYFSTLTNKKTF